MYTASDRRHNCFRHIAPYVVFKDIDIYQQQIYIFYNVSFDVFTFAGGDDYY